MFFLCNTFLVLDIALIRCISKQAKTILFMGQNLKAKNYTYFGMERVSYTTYSLNSTKPSKKSPTCKRIALSVSLLAARLEPLSPGSVSSLVRLRPSSCPPNRRYSSAPSSLPPHLSNGNSGVADRRRLAIPAPAPQHQHEGGWHYLLLWICYGRDNLIVHYIAY